jgi:GNAT superfamily N-acetyltransferase
MIKIEPLFAPDCTQTRALLRYQNDPIPYESFCAEDVLAFRGLTFWQHWVPYRMHIGSSVYIAKEEGVVLGVISLRAVGKSGGCWRIEHVVVHPHHRGRGIAQELLHYVFALFGSQGIGHFIVEASDLNAAGLSLLRSCGFRRCAKIVHYQVPSELQIEADASVMNTVRLATPEDKQGLYTLHQDALPIDLRLIQDLVPDDFSTPYIAADNLEKTARRLNRRKRWFWVSADPSRNVLTSAAKVIAHRQGDYHLEFAVHPGWTHMAKPLIEFVLTTMRQAQMKGMILAKAYDYQPAVLDVLQECGLERSGEFSLMAREHWIRAKQPRALKLDSVGIPSLGKPAINMPRLYLIKSPDKFLS